MARRDPAVLGLVMAGGEGTRLHPLTQHRCKPAVPFSGTCRLVDFVLSNFANSGIGPVYLLVQYKSQELIEHVRCAWGGAGGAPGRFVSVVPPQMHSGLEWFRGTADSIRQNLHLIREHRPDLVAVFGADHVYRMDLREMIDAHLDAGADASVATVPVPLERCAAFGIVETDARGRVREFHEKPDAVAAMPGRPGHALASMGNYLFSAELLLDELEQAKHDDAADFGRDLLPRLVSRSRLCAYDFATHAVPGAEPFEEPHYWRDVGTIDAYFEAHFDTLGPQPRFRLFNPRWPLHGSLPAAEPAQIESGSIVNAAVSAGCVVTDARLDRAMLGRSVRVGEDAQLQECIVMARSVIGRGAKIRRAIVDEDNHVPDGEVIGLDPARDALRFSVSEGGVTVVPRGFFKALCA